MFIRMYTHHLSTQLLGQIEVIDQVTLPCQRNPVRSFAVALNVENREPGIKVCSHACRLPNDLPSPLFTAVDHCQDAAVQLCRIDGYLIFDLLLHAQRHLFQGQFAQLENVLLPEKVIQSCLYFFGLLVLARLQAID